jgi:hypothetical protein
LEWGSLARTPGAAQSAVVTRPWRDAEDAAGDDPALVCSVCETRVTRAAAGIDRGGAHEHTFVNPGGHVHRVRCFATASGLAEVGDPETAFTWFPGYSWQILDCGRCRVHIGWLFRCADDRFYGLVADRLVER